MSGASEAAAALKTAALASYCTLKDSVAAAAAAVIRLREAEDLMQVFQAANDYSLAAETLADIAKEVNKQADAALVVAMHSTGGTQFRSATHTISLRQNPPSVDITDPKAVPEAYLTQPDPKPDKALVRDALRNGAPINWAVLRDGSLSLQRKAIT